MNLESRQVFVLTQAVCGLIEAMGMFAHDLREVKHRQGQIYTEEAYQQLIEKYGLHSNAVLHYLRD